MQPERARDTSGLVHVKYFYGIACDLVNLPWTRVDLEFIPSETVPTCLWCVAFLKEKK